MSAAIWRFISFALVAMSAMSSPPSSPSSAGRATIRLLISGGDNMLGRAVQLSCFHRTPGEETVTDSMPAAYYLDLSLLHPSSNDGDADLPLSTIRERNREGGSYMWGDYLGMRIHPPPQLRLFNLETSVTESIANRDVPWHKGICYHLNPRNLRELLAGYERERHGGASGIPYALCFANNHAMDFGRAAFEQETIPAMAAVLAPPALGRLCGAGEDIAAAGRPAEFQIAIAAAGDDDDDELQPSSTATVQVFAMATLCSGALPDWVAGETRPGLVLLPALRSRAAVDEACRRAMEVFRRHRRPGAIAVLSVHWGPNWAYRDGRDDDGQRYRRELAHRLVDAGAVHLIYGHSSHHVRGMERHAGKLVVYGAGDLINDYEGFSNPGEERYSRLGAVFVADLDAESGDLRTLRLVPMFVDRLRLRRVREGSRIWDLRSQEMKEGAGAAREFVGFLNAMSEADAGKQAVKLRLVPSDAAIPGGPVLVYP